MSINLMEKVSDKLYLVMDDRNFTYDSNIILPTIDLLNSFGFKICSVLRYTEYVSIAMVYLHRLINNGNVILETNNFKKMFNISYNLFLIDNKIKLYLKNDSDTLDNRCILYDNGWIRGILLDVIIDDIENIIYNNHELDIEANDNSMKKKIVSLLNLNSSICRTNEIYEHINKIISRAKIDDQLCINMISLDVLSNMGIGIEEISRLITNDSLSLGEYIVICNNNSPKLQNIDRYNIPNSSDVYCIIDPVTITTTNQKKFIIGNKLFVDRASLIINTGTETKNKIKLKYAGTMDYKMEYGTTEVTYIVGNWCKNKRKKRNNKCIDWIPYMNDNVFCYTDHISNKKHTIVMFPKISINKKIFKIQNYYYHLVPDIQLIDNNVNMRLLVPFNINKQLL